MTNRISEILGNDDDVVIETCINMVENAKPVRSLPDPPRRPHRSNDLSQLKIKEVQLNMTGFLEKDAATFCKELYKLLLSAQSSPQGVPKELLEAKKLELMQERVSWTSTPPAEYVQLDRG